MKAVVIGASAGGIEALLEILKGLPASYSLPIIIVLHIPNGQTTLLAEIFTQKVKLKVKMAEKNESLKHSTIYFAPPNHHLVIEKNKTLFLTTEEQVNYSRPSIDVLFESASVAYGSDVVGILLTGANKDGSLGLKKIQEAKGVTIVQDPNTAKMPMMPASGIPYVSTECVLSLPEISNYLLKINQTDTETETKNNKENKLEILIVDDNNDNLFALKSLLKRDDIDILEAKSGSCALELMMKHDFCLALLDIQMPVMDGFELAVLMRGTNKTKNIPIIFVTATAKNERYDFKGYESGAVDFLRKPLDPHAVKCKVNVFLELQINKNELKKQVQELNETKEELKRAINVRDEFISIAGHELKTPLTSIKLQADMRKRSLENESYTKFTPDKLIKMFDTDSKQIERMTVIINDMLDVTRISSGKLSMNLEDFDLSTLIYDVVERNHEQLEESGNQITIDSGKNIVGRWDKFRIEQVITNLLTNAIKYGEGKPIEIKINSENDKAIVVIKDHGLGISKENIKLIFKRFERVTGTDVSGLGLGLYIVSSIIEAHKGQIKVESQLGQGSSFSIELPLNVFKNYKI